MFQLYKFKVSAWPDTEYGACVDFLQESEKEHVKRFHHVIDQKRSASSHLMSKLYLSKLHHRDLRTIHFERSKENRPMWLDYDASLYPCLNFNMSHSGSWSIAGLATHGVIGVDVQEVRLPGRLHNIQRFLRQLRSSFTWREWCTICLQDDLSGSEDSVFQYLDFRATTFQLKRIEKRMFCYWVLKESYIKAIGTGIYLEFDRVEFIFPKNGRSFSENISEPDYTSSSCPLVDSTVDLLQHEPVLVMDGVYYSKWHFRLFEIDSEHVAAVASGPVTDPNITASFGTSLKHHPSSTSPPSSFFHDDRSERESEDIEVVPSSTSTPTPTLSPPEPIFPDYPLSLSLGGDDSDDSTSSVGLIELEACRLDSVLRSFDRLYFIEVTREKLIEDLQSVGLEVRIPPARTCSARPFFSSPSSAPSSTTTSRPALDIQSRDRETLRRSKSSEEIERDLIRRNERARARAQAQAQVRRKRERRQGKGGRSRFGDAFSESVARRKRQRGRGQGAGTGAASASSVDESKIVFW